MLTLMQSCCQTS